MRRRARCFWYCSRFVLAIMALGLFLTFEILNFLIWQLRTFPLAEQSRSRLRAAFRRLWRPSSLLPPVLCRQCHWAFATPKGRYRFYWPAFSSCRVWTRLMLLVMGGANCRFYTMTKLINSHLQISLRVCCEVVIGIFSAVSWVDCCICLPHPIRQAFIAAATIRKWRAPLVLLQPMKCGADGCNGLIALSGALLAQSDGYADVNKGFGVIVIGLSANYFGWSFIWRCDTRQTPNWHGARRNFVPTLTRRHHLYRPGYHLPEGHHRYHFGRLLDVATLYGKKGDEMSYLTFENLNFSVSTSDEEKKIINNVNLAIEEKSFTVILGGNGAGKSTLLTCLTGTWDQHRGRFL